MVGPPSAYLDADGRFLIRRKYGFNIAFIRQSAPFFNSRRSPLIFGYLA